MAGKAANDALIPVGADAPAVIEGCLDAVAGGRAYGWAWDRTRPAEPVEVEIRLGDRVLARVRADRPRPDLESGGVGDGRHAFEVELPAGVGAGDLTAIAHSPATGAAVPLAVPTAEEKAVGAALNPHLTRLTAVLEQLRTDQRNLGQLQQATARTVRDLAARPADGEAAIAGLQAALDRLEQGQTALTERIGAVEVFLLRMDESLQRLERNGGGEARTGMAQGGLSDPRLAVAGVAALALIGLAALLAALF